MSEGGESASEWMLVSDAAAIGIEQKLPVTAAHHLESEADKTASLVAQLVRDPIALGDRRGVEETRCNVRVGDPEETRIQRAQREDETLAAFLRESADIRARPTSSQASPQAQCRGGADFE